MKSGITKIVICLESGAGNTLRVLSRPVLTETRPGQVIERLAACDLYYAPMIDIVDYDRKAERPEHLP
jgi:hypothetical protein